ncbi:MAG TPA: hypothetical protein V6D47_21060 [Oscillatoriaceae cyanobacterium]
MSQTTPQQELTPEEKEALAKLTKTAAMVTKELKHAREACKFSLEATRGPLEFVKTKLAEVADLEAQAEAKREQLDYTFVSQTLVIHRRMFEASQRMIEIQRSFDTRNLAIAEEALATLATANDDPVRMSNLWVGLNESGKFDEVRFALPIDSPAYLEARAQMYLYLGLQHWQACLEGIDAILRATVNDTAIEPRDEAEEAQRAEAGRQVAALMKGNREAMQVLQHLGTELQEAFSYFQWAAAGLRNLKELSDDIKLARLKDADWQKLSGKTVLIIQLIDKVQPFPELAALFPPPQKPELPYEELEWQDRLRELPISGTGRLGTGRLGSPNSKTGPLQGKTGSLQNGTGSLQNGTGSLSNRKP